MALYRLSVSTFSRLKGASAIAKAAYRSGTKMRDEKRGITFDFRRKRGVVSATLLAPAGLTLIRENIMNAVESAEKRRDASILREILLALPHELPPASRERCAMQFAAEIVAEFSVFADVAIHEPNPRGDDRNFHCHVLIPTRALDAGGRLSAGKLRSFDDKRESTKIVSKFRARWAEIVNGELAAEGRSERIDHRKNPEQIEDRKTPEKLGVAAANIERRTGLMSEKRKKHGGQGRAEELALLATFYELGHDKPKEERRIIKIDLSILRVLIQSLAVKAETAIRQLIRDLTRQNPTQLAALSIDRPAAQKTVSSQMRLPSTTTIGNQLPSSRGRAIAVSTMTGFAKPGPQKSTGDVEDRKRVRGLSHVLGESQKAVVFHPKEELLMLHAAGIAMFIAIKPVGRDRRWLRAAIAAIAAEFGLEEAVLASAIGDVECDIPRSLICMVPE
jgi:hypothetical protein